MKQIAIGVLGILLAYFLIKRGDNSITEEAFLKSENLCNNAVKTSGYLDSTYTETTMKIAKVKMKFYNYSATFTAQGKEYKTTFSTTEPIKDEFIKPVWYDSQDPENNSTTNACERHEENKFKNVSSHKDAFSIGGILLGLISLSITFGGVKGLFRGNK
ncbi:hypothetical protein GCM10028808_74250 [Spirosoma migulaei]